MSSCLRQIICCRCMETVLLCVAMGRREGVGAVFRAELFVIVVV